jgi:hypothetical protein
VSIKDISDFANEMYGINTTWIQATNLVKSLDTIYYRGASSKAKNRRYGITLCVLENYLNGDTDPQAPKTSDIDRYITTNKWPINI